MGKTIVVVISGLVLAILMGRELLTAYRTDSTPLGRGSKVRVPRERHPRIFWFAVALYSAFFLFGIGLAGWALIWPGSVR